MKRLSQQGHLGQRPINPDSGGHPGLMTALMSGLVDEPPAEMGRLQTWAENLPKVQEECRKVYEGLRGNERAGLRGLVHGQGPGRKALPLLQAKGLVINSREGGESIPFSPLFADFLRKQTETIAVGLQVDEQTGIVVVNGEKKRAFRGKVHELFDYLYSRVGEVCSRDEIGFKLYPERKGDVADNTIDALVRRLRQEIEDDPSSPQYLKTVHGRGFQLVLKPDEPMADNAPERSRSSA